MTGWEVSSKRWGFYEEEEEEIQDAARAAGSASVRQDPASQRHADAEPARELSGTEQSSTEQSGVGLDERLINQVEHVLGSLVAQSAGYPGLEWAAAAYLDGEGRTHCYATSNEGFGYLPWALRWPNEVQHVFGMSVPEGQTLSWQGLVNPTRVIVDHYAMLQAEDKTLRLVAVGTSAPSGDIVRRFAREHGARFVGAGAGGPGSPSGIARLETVDRGVFAAVRAVPEANRWSKGLALLGGAFRACSAAVPYSGLSDVAQRAWSGEVSDYDLGLVRQAAAQLRVQAQVLRVSDDRLGEVHAPATGMDRFVAEATPRGGVMGYAVPFQHARVCVILERIVAGWVHGRYLGADELAELAYEHYCVVEDVAATAEVLRRVS